MVGSAGPTYLISEGLSVIDVLHEAGVVEGALVEDMAGRGCSAEGHWRRMVVVCAQVVSESSADGYRGTAEARDHSTATRCIYASTSFLFLIPVMFIYSITMSKDPLLQQQHSDINNDQRGRK